MIAALAARSLVLPLALCLATLVSSCARRQEVAAPAPLVSEVPSAALPAPAENPQVRLIPVDGGARRSAPPTPPQPAQPGPVTAHAPPVVQCRLVDEHGQLAPADVAAWRAVVGELGNVAWGEGETARLATPLRPSAVAEHLRAGFLQPLGLDVSPSALVTVSGNRVEVVLSPR